MRNKHKVYIIVFAIVWILAIVSFWTLFDPTDALGYSIFILQGLCPICIIMITFHFGRICYKRWIIPLMGICYMLSDYLTFKLANSIGTDKINPISISYFAIGMFISFISYEIAKEARSKK